ncbi:DUF2510 domain-containing protein [Mycobacterium sp. Root265]|uniref:DUF2510 domain-containing protein n=1 Tax=Mycobacterium sp. Root265 TaxID=1736504 RepID=UPI001F4300CD|nr:DUF2510 domain-containing protein [Mycobacterium sp. Root265]
MTNPPGWYPDPLGGHGARYWDGTQWDGAIQPEPQEFPEPPPPRVEKPRRNWPVWVGLAATAAIAVGSAAFVMTRTPSDAPQATPTAVPTTTAASPTPAPTEAVAGEVERAMQRTLDDDPDLKGLTVVEVLLVHKSGNEYKGIATVKAADDTEHDVPVDVTADDENVLWETPPGAFAFAEESRPSPPAPPPPRVPPPPPPPVLSPGEVENFRLCPSGLTGVASAETSCAFADNVRRAWYGQPGSVVTAYSPVTGRLYTMRCAAADTDAWSTAQRCTGTNPQGDPLIVYIS